MLAIDVFSVGDVMCSDEVNDLHELLPCECHGAFLDATLTGAGYRLST